MGWRRKKNERRTSNHVLAWPNKEAEMIKVNAYFDGKVKSLAFDIDGRAYTAGVFSTGEYTVGTEKEEHVTVSVGELNIRLPAGEWQVVKSGQTIVIPAGIEFEARAEKPASYVCQYS
jgi:purine/pyrimidine-nucleoside phosphorylase